MSQSSDIAEAGEDIRLGRGYTTKELRAKLGIENGIANFPAVYGMKLAIVVRTDLHMSKGKLAAQVAHAAVACYRNSIPVLFSSMLHTKSENGTASCGDNWFVHFGQKKIVLKVDTLDDLLKIEASARKSGLVVERVVDPGLTQIEPNTITCIGIGPDDNDEIDSVTSGLKLL